MANESAIFRLPTELIQHIACFLSDDDLCSFSRTCVSFAAQLLPANSGVWRSKFRDQYDSVQDHSSEELKVEYQTRAFVLLQAISFRHGETEQGYLWLEVVQTMLLEALLYTSTVDSFQPLSKNLERIAEMIPHTEFLSRPITGYGDETVSEPSRLFCAIQLCLTHLSFSTKYSRPCSRDDYNIEYVYSYASLFHIPLVVQGKVDLKTLLHIRNFWQRHFTSSQTDTFFKSYQDISERPDTWRCPFEQRDIPKTFWMGYYSCIHPYPGTAKGLKSSQTCADLGPHTAELCANSISLEIDNNAQNWPQLLNEVIPMSADCPSQVFFRGTQKYYSSTDSSAHYLVRGFLEPIAEPQGEIPGWTRICFITYDANRDILATFGQEGGDDQTTEKQGPTNSSFPDEDWPPADLEWSFHFIYGFEGVILPGGRIMLGQWLDIKEEGALDCDRGPFIYWDA